MGDSSLKPTTKMTSRRVLNINAYDLHQAVVAGRLESLKDMLQNGTLNALIVNKTVGGATALSITLYKDKRDCFEFLLNHRVFSSLLDINKLSKDDKYRVEPVLVTACRLQNITAVRMILARPDTDVNRVDTEGRSALWMATNKRNVQIVRMLLSAGADPNCHSTWRLSPLYYAVRYSSKRLPIAGMLIEAGADVAEYARHHCLLHVALKQGDRGVSDLLVAVGYPVSKNEALVSAARHGRLSGDCDLNRWVVKHASIPITLLLQCRVAVRRMCTNKGKLSSLEIPVSLVNYLQLSDVIDAYYEELAAT